MISLTSAISVCLEFTFLFALVTQGKLNCIKSILPCHFVSPNPTEQRGDFPFIPRHFSQAISSKAFAEHCGQETFLAFSHAPRSVQLFQKFC